MLVALFVNDVEGWKLATLAFIVEDLKVAAGAVKLVVGVDTLGNCGAATRLAVEATCSENEDEACAGDTIVVDCAVTDWSPGELVSTFLMADLFAILPDFAEEPLASDETEVSMRPEAVAL